MWEIEALRGFSLHTPVALHANEEKSHRMLSQARLLKLGVHKVARCDSRGVYCPVGLIP
jgi:hypothetical protein